jgi:hypothetical protein
MPPPVQPSPLDSLSREEERVRKTEHIFTSKVMNMMRSFQRVSRVLMNHLEKKEGRVSTHVRGLQNPSNNHMHRELEKR